ncbi:MAG TPA: UPF0182 family protein [Jatrophihabitantaceae bacterium]|jgi:hypothetical protein|nr:UPF0182 family protein [Jatrophihabitantaceae bacterium]
MRPPIPSLTLSRRWKIALAVAGILIVLIIVAASLTGVYVNWLWFGQIGYRKVYSTALWTRIWLFVIFGVLMSVIIGGNLLVAYLMRPPFRPMSAEQQNLERYRVMVEPRKRLILAGVMLLALFAAGMSAQGKWQTWLLWLNGGPFGIKDPQFHRDIGFYAWDYPAYRVMLGFGFSAVLFALILSIGVHYLTGAIRLQTPGPKVTPAARRHLTALVFVFMALKAVAYWLDRYGLVFSNRSKFTGASYTDVHASLQAKTILFWLAIIIALGVLASMWLRSALLPGIGFVVLLVLSILISGIYPAIVQQVTVKPNASDKERTYIGRNITATRQAYDIVTQNTADPNGRVSYVDYPVTPTPSASALSPTNTTIGNIRILDPNVVSPTFTQLQRIKNPYGFANNLDMDRYTTQSSTGASVTHDYVVGVRELNPANLTGSQGNWINAHTVYTHGYGFVAAEADVDITNREAPFAAGDIPPNPPGTTGSPLGLTTPQVYYGELLNDYSIVGATGTPREYDGADSTTTYGGKGGVSLGSFANRLAFAVHFKQTNFLLNSAASSKGAKLIFNRDPRQRVEKVAPFLTVDGDPYPVISGGRLVWIVDAYTTMANYPYSERQSLSDLTGTSLSKDQANRQINYIRNSVKATVDAYDGTVTLYQWDTKDPVLKAWMKIFPGIVKPASQMPQTIRDHVRYPEDLFDVQRSLLEQYHVDDPVTFYNVRDKWTVPADPNAASGDQPPYYVLADTPGGTGTAAQFQLTTPMMVNNSPNLAAYISADSDPGTNYGKITVLRITNNGAIQGPQQIANVFKTNTQISKDISLLNQGQSSIIHGNLLTLPVGGTFLYVEPLYVQSSYPTLQRVLVSYGDRIGYGATLANALSDLQDGHVTGETLNIVGSTAPSGGGGTTTPSTPAPSTTPSGGVSGLPLTQQAALAQLNTAFTDLQNAYKSGDFVAIGNAQARVQQLLQAYVAKYGSPTTTPSVTPTTSRTK